MHTSGTCIALTARAHAQPTSAEVTLAPLRMPELTIADIEQADEDSLRYRYE